MEIRLRCQVCDRQITLLIPGVAWCCGKEMQLTRVLVEQQERVTFASDS